MKRLQLICLLKSIGLSLGSVKGILGSESPEKVLLLLLDEQAKQLEDDIAARQEQLKKIHAIKTGIGGAAALPINAISGIGHMMDSKKKLKRVHLAMLGVGLVMDAVQIGALALWIATGIWWPFAVGMALVIVAGLLATRMYHRNTAFLCAMCDKTFRPPFGQFTFSSHTPKARKLACPACGHTGYCVEVAAEHFTG